MFDGAATALLLNLTGEVLIVLAFLHMLSTRRSASSLIAWTLAIFLIPYVAVPLYFIFGHRKLIRRYDKLTFQLEPLGDTRPLCRHPVEKVLTATGVPPATADNRFDLIATPDGAFDRFMAAIEEAKESIDICVYQLRIDETTRQILAALRKKAQSGVRVRLLCDSIGSMGVYLFPAKLRALAGPKVEIAFFMPFLRLPVRNLVNLRNHRKIYIFDRRTVLTGGMNLADEYMTPRPKEALYTDILCTIEGSAVSFYRQIFEEDWHFATGAAKPAISHTAPLKSGGSCIQVAPSGPDTPSDSVADALLAAICQAKRRVTIVTPYFVPDEDFVRALGIAAHRGTEVRLLVPERSDHLISDLGRGSFLRELAGKGAHILLYRGPVLHAKAMLFDDCAVVGSVNFDNRSLFYNFEAVSFLYTPDDIDRLAAWIEELTHDTVSYRPADGTWRIRMENFMRMVAPLV